jgi:hypothetical protein
MRRGVHLCVSVCFCVCAGMSSVSCVHGNVVLCTSTAERVFPRHIMCVRSCKVPILGANADHQDLRMITPKSTSSLLT